MRLVHSDWSVSPTKRWTAEALREPEGWYVPSLNLTGSIDAFMKRLVDQARDDVVVAGFDFLIGVPAAYGARTGLPEFPTLLDAVGRGAWEHFATPAREPGEITTQRPFYPGGTGEGARRQELAAGLGVDRFENLLRLCERPHESRPHAASVLFWTVGGSQVGKAALSGWLEVIRPGLERGARLWPFHGSLRALTTTPGLVLAETYPAESYGPIGVRLRGTAGKTDQVARLDQVAALERWAEARRVHWAPEVAELIHGGFGDDKAGEDRFDALLGLLGMIEAVEADQGEAPDRPEVTTWEGWILGQRAPVTVEHEGPAETAAPASPPLQAEPASRTQPRAASSLSRRSPDDLLALGFVDVGAWALEANSLVWRMPEDEALRALTESPNTLYAFVEGEAVRYIGKTTRGIRRRFVTYARPGKTQATNLKCNALIRRALQAGREVRILAFAPVEHLRYGEFGINLAAGLEDSLIRIVEPSWNGSEGGRLLTETEEREAEEEGSGEAPAAHQPAAASPLARFTVVLGPTYYERGMVNPGMEASRYLGGDGETLLVHFADGTPSVPTRINRTANSSGAVRLAGGNSAFAAWFQKHYSLGDSVPCEVLGAHAIRFGLASADAPAKLATDQAQAS